MSRNGVWLHGSPQEVLRSWRDGVLKPGREILLVEDNMADAELTMDTFGEVNSAAIVHHVSDGEAAIAFLRKEGKHVDAPKPDLILLDLNLPRKNGREVLSEIKTDRRLKLIPVIVLSSSSSPNDVLNSYDLHANCYVNKPENLSGFNKIVSAINDYWLNLASLPGSVNTSRSGATET